MRQSFPQSLSIPPLPPLLFRQACLLSALAGLAAMRQPVWAVVAAALLWLGMGARGRGRARTVVYALCFCAGLGAVWLRQPGPPPPTPAWADTGRPVRFSGTVAECASATDGRIRVLLRDVRPEAGTAESEADPPGGNIETAGAKSVALPGLLALSWQNPPRRLAPGTRLTVTAAVSSLRGLANPGGDDGAAFWALRGVGFRAWTAHAGGAPHVAGDPSAGWRFRECLRTAMLRAMALHDGPTDGNTAASAEKSRPGRFGAVTPRHRDGDIPTAGTDPASAPAPAAGPVGALPSAPGPPTPAGAFLPALVLGDRFHLDSRDLDLVARASLIHAIALSGMHLCAAAALGAGVALLAGRMVPGVYLRIPRRKLALACSLPPALAYVWLGGAPPSLVRAALMLVFWTWLYWRGRPQALLDGLLWAVCALVLIDPGAADDLSLQLSACAVAGIALAGPLAALLPRRLRALAGFAPRDRNDGVSPAPAVAPPANRRPARTRRSRLLMYGTRTLWITLCIQLTLLPLSARVFGVSSPWFALNVLFLPLVDGVALPLGLAGMTLAPVAPEVAGWLLLAARWPFDLLLVSLRWLESAGLLGNPQLLRPHPAAMLGLWVLLGAAVLHVSGEAHRRAAGLLVAGILLVLGPVWPRFTAATDPAVRLALLDVGQGQSVSLDWGSGRMLTDGGGTASRSWDTGRRVVAPALTDNRPPRLDMVAWSHPDRDHMRGLLHIIDTFAVRRVAGNGALPRGEDATRLAAILGRAGQRVERWRSGQRLPLADGLELEVLHPPLPEASGPAFDGNDASLVLRLTARDARGARRGLALLPGDAGDPALRALLDSGTDLSAEVLVLPHHGGKRQLLPRLLDAVRPRAALASAGYRNRWGFPVAATRDALAERAIPLLVTAESGRILVRWDAVRTGGNVAWPGPATVGTVRQGEGEAPEAGRRTAGTAARP